MKINFTTLRDSSRRNIQRRQSFQIDIGGILLHRAKLPFIELRPNLVLSVRVMNITVAILLLSDITGACPHISTPFYFLKLLSKFGDNKFLIYSFIVIYR